jgi:hypothetical protein
MIPRVRDSLSSAVRAFTPVRWLNRPYLLQKTNCRLRPQSSLGVHLDAQNSTNSLGAGVIARGYDSQDTLRSTKWGLARIF